MFVDGKFGIALQGLDFQQLYVNRRNLAQTAVMWVNILMQRLNQEASQKNSKLYRRSALIET